MRLVRRKARRPEAVEKLQLERVIGLTSLNGNGLASNPENGDVAFLAGCVVIVYSTETFRQTRFFMVSRTPKALACVAYSPHGGKLIAAGECGHQPAVIVWDASDGSCLAQLKAHKYGISCVKFSPNGKHLLSAGVPHDGQICLFDFKSGTLISKMKAAMASSSVSEMSFASDGSFFVTAGSNQLKHWSMGFHASRQRSTSVSLGAHSLDARNINLGSLSESSFVAVVSSEHLKESNGTSGIRPVYALAAAGILCLLHHGLAVKKWVNLKVQHGNSLCLSGSHIACACNNGIVRIFMTETLTYVATLPRPAPLGFHDLTDANTCVYLAGHSVDGISYPDAVACRFATPVKLVVIYADHSLFIWNVESFSNIQRCQSYLSHSECIWDVTNLPGQLYKDADITHVCDSARGFEGQGMFATCSSDGSIRLWCIECAENGVSNATEVNENHINVYDKSLSGVFYQDKRGGPDVISLAANQIDSMDSTRGFRSISVSCDGQFLAAGDRSGNLHIYDLNSFQIANFKEAHDAEILTLSFGSVAVETADNKRSEVALLASGGRDRLVHVYNASRDFEVVETLDDHSASVTALKFACDGSKLLSAGADKSVVFRNVGYDGLDIKSTRYHQEMASRGTVYDLDIDISKKLAVTVGQDKKLNFLSLSTGKSVKSFKPEGDCGEPIKVKIDPSGTCFVCSHSDKSLRIYDISNSELLSSGQGHSEVITGVIFMPDCKRLISVSGDSCIFVWKLPTHLSKMMRKKCNSHSEFHAGHASVNTPDLGVKKDVMSSTATEVHTSSDDMDPVNVEALSGTLDAGSGIPSAFKFSVSRLPHWAQAKVSQTIAELDESNPEYCSLHSSDSRWAERLGAQGYKLFSEPEVSIPPPTVLPINHAIRRRFTIEPSASSAYSTPESSLESQLSGTSNFSPCVSGRKHSHWKTVHTLFFDEDEEYPRDDAVLDVPPGKDKEGIHNSHSINIEQQEIEKFGKNNSTMDQQHPTMSLISMLSHNKCAGRFNSKQEHYKSYFQTPAPLACMVDNRSERADLKTLGSNSSPTPSGRLDFREEIQSSTKSSRNDDSERQEDPLVVPLVDETSDEDESDIPLSPDRDLFSSHFGSLSTAVKVQAGQASARSSFSARFFAQGCYPLPVISLFHDTPKSEAIQNMKAKSTLIGADFSTCTLLTKERELLKLKELQDQGASTTTIFSTCSQTLLNDDNGKEPEALDEEQQALSTVKEQGPLTFSGTSIADSKADNDHCCLDLSTMESAVMADNSIAAAHVLPSSFDQNAYSIPEPNLNVQIEAPSMPSDILFSKNGDVSDDPSISSGDEKNAIGQKEGLSLIEEDNCKNAMTVVPGSTTFDSMDGKETVNELKRALQDLAHAADKALALFRELDLTSRLEERDGAMVTSLSILYEEFIPPTLQKVWLLSDGLTAIHQTSQATTSACDHQPSLEYSRSPYSDHGFLRLSNTGGIIPRPCTAASVTASSSALESIDIEGFLHNYSVRFSETLASQVLALVQKGLSHHPSNE